jgi:tetratricopeptide (TPR) repeat protein
MGAEHRGFSGKHREGAVLMKQGKYANAEPPIREGLEIRRQVLGNSHLDTGMSLYRLSDLLYTTRDYRGAESAARESVDVFNRALTSPGENLYFANPLTALGLVLNKTGRSREAEAYLREALGIRTRLLPDGNALVGASEGALGECLTTERRFAEAEPLLLRSYRSAKSSAGDHDSRTKNAVRRLITLYESWGRANEAAGYRRELLDSSQ